MSQEFLDSLRELIDEFEASPCRAGVITGYEKFFSAGLALPVLYGLERDDLRRFMLHFTTVMLQVFMTPKPLIAAINGHAIAGGCVLALQCDYRVMAEGDFKIGLNEVQIGLGLPAVVLETLTPQVPQNSLLPIAMEGRLFNPEEAFEVGLVHDVVPPTELMETALERANELAANPSSGVAQVKRSLRAPIVEKIQHVAGRDLEAWLDTWYSPEAREKIGETVAKLRR